MEAVHELEEGGNPGVATRARRVVKKLRLMVSGQGIGATYYPEEPRKSRARIFADFIWWGIRHLEVSNYYFCCGLDRKSVRLDDYLGYRHFRRLRDSRNAPRNRRYSYVCVLQDKFLFGQLLASLKIPTPESVAMLDRNSVTWLDGSAAPQPLESLVARGGPDLGGFCKKYDGIKGEGAFPLRLAGGRLFSQDAEIGLESCAGASTAAICCSGASSSTRA